MLVSIFRYFILSLCIHLIGGLIQLHVFKNDSSTLDNHKLFYTPWTYTLNNKQILTINNQLLLSGVKIHLQHHKSKTKLVISTKAPHLKIILTQPTIVAFSINGNLILLVALLKNHGVNLVFSYLLTLHSNPLDYLLSSPLKYIKIMVQFSPGTICQLYYCSKAVLFFSG